MTLLSLRRGALIALVAAAALAETPAFVEPTVWAPYFKDEKGVKTNMVEPIEKNTDKQWFSMEWTRYRGPKLLLSIQIMDNTKAGAAPAGRPDPNDPAAYAVYIQQMQLAMMGARAGTAAVPVSGIEDLLATALMNSHRFELLERKEMNAIMTEKRLDASKDEAPAVDLQKNLNKVITAPFTIKGSITEWTPDKSKVGGGGGGFGKGLLGGIGVSKATAEVAMTFRIIDNQTTKIVDSVTVHATADNWGLDLGLFGGGSAGMGGMKEKSPVNYAVISAINKGVYEMAKRLGDKPWTGRVSMNKNGVIFIVGGQKEGLEEGMILDACKLGDEIKDPTTGEVLDRETTPLGKIKITAVKEKYSLATNVQGCETIATGDRVDAVAGPSIFAGKTPGTAGTN